MTTQQDSVDVERLYEKVREIEQFVSLMIPHVPLHVRRNNEAEMVKIAGYFADLRAALTLPITQRDEQGDQTCADGPKDAEKPLSRNDLYRFMDTLKLSEKREVAAAIGFDASYRHGESDFDRWKRMWRWAAENDKKLALATAIRRLSIKQGDQDGGER